MDNYLEFVQRLPNKELEKLLLAIFEDKVRRKKLIKKLHDIQIKHAEEYNKQTLKPKKKSDRTK